MAHEQRWRTSISLVASENVLSVEVRSLLASDIGNRVAEGPRGGRWFPGLSEYDEIENLGEEVCKELFSCEAVEIRPISGTLANAVVYRALCKPGDSIAALSIGDGGHASMAGRLIQTLDYVPQRIEFSLQDLNVNGPASRDLLMEVKPRLLVLGGSVLLFPQPVAELASAVHSYGGVVVFDASHVAGLIAGGQYPNPLLDGADLLTFSTCKTIPGPQHAIVAGKSELIKLVAEKAHLFHSGHHLHETVAAILSLIEMQQFGRAYAERVCKNAQVLAQALAVRGFAVLADSCGRHTSTHMFMVDAANHGGGAALERKLEAVGIFVNRNPLPGQKGETIFNPRGIRLGTQEVTRVGMQEPEMVELAELIASAAGDRDLPDVLARVRVLRDRFPEPLFVFADA